MNVQEALAMIDDLDKSAYVSPKIKIYFQNFRDWLLVIEGSPCLKVRNKDKENINKVYICLEDLEISIEGTAVWLYPKIKFETQENTYFWKIKSGIYADIQDFTGVMAGLNFIFSKIRSHLHEHNVMGKEMLPVRSVLMQLLQGRWDLAHIYLDQLRNFEGIYNEVNTRQLKSYNLPLVGHIQEYFRYFQDSSSYVNPDVASFIHEIGKILNCFYTDAGGTIMKDYNHYVSLIKTDDGYLCTTSKDTDLYKRYILYERMGKQLSVSK